MNMIIFDVVAVFVVRAANVVKLQSGTAVCLKRKRKAEQVHAGQRVASVKQLPESSPSWEIVGASAGMRALAVCQCL